MKKKTIAALVAGLGLASAAQAQSSVTLYGRLDNGIEYIHGVTNGNGQSANRWRGESGDWGTSMLGFKGTEDLGGGNYALFQLEQGLNTANGTVGGNGGFNRWATVGLKNKDYGTLSAGRMLWISNGVWDFDPFVQEAWSSASLVRGRNWPQTSNNIRYQSPVVGGFDVELRMSLGNQTNFNQGAVGSYGRSTGAQLTYTNSLFQIRGLYDELRDSNGRFSDLFNYSKEYVVAANVFLGSFKLQGAYTHMMAGDVTTAGAATAADHEWLGLTYQVNPVVAVTVGGFHINANGNPAQGGGAATIYEVGGTYNLSKRTFLYLTGAQARNTSNATYGLGANSVGSADNALPGHTQTGFYAGINHTF
ncbi:porin [Robbsia sp. Bb-Pol-6]|uniref:Porin n=1 Tax=Robbsia betulipollinis TaxID=2981849 RepID=A0ABT3ZSB5_9BURK|nr:porin [Robbsia betulipollinis]MCY0389436.1 porin [Robbsia betulipollinis]